MERKKRGRNGEKQKQKHRQMKLRNKPIWMFLSVEGKWTFSLLLFPHLLVYSSEEWLDLWVRKDGALQPGILTGFHSNKHCTPVGIGKCGVEGWNSNKHWLSDSVCLRAHAIISTVLKCWRGRNQKLTTPTSLLGGRREGKMEGEYLHSC